MDLQQHLCRQIAFSRGTFGPGDRTAGLLDHIRKELEEIEASGGALDEWIDVIILAFDGATRRLQARGWGTDAAAVLTCVALREKQGVNEARDWPDWRTAPADKAIEHVRENEGAS